MNRLKLAYKSFAYSWNLIFESSKFMIFLYFALMLITTSFPLLSAFLLKYVLDALTVATPEIEKVLAVVIVYGLSLVVNQGITSAKDLVKRTIDQKARHLYQCRLAEKLSELPMDVLDSSKGKDQIDEVRYMEFTSVYLIFRLTDIISFLYTFVVAFTTLAVFSLGFSLMFLAFTIPSIIFNEYYARKSEELREKTAPDVRKFHYYRWMLTDAWPAKDVRMYDLTDAIKSRYSKVKILADEALSTAINAVSSSESAVSTANTAAEKAHTAYTSAVSASKNSVSAVTIAQKAEATVKREHTAMSEEIEELSAAIANGQGTLIRDNGKFLAIYDTENIIENNDTVVIDGGGV